MTQLPRRVATFAGFALLAGYASWHWFALIGDVAAWRWALCLAAALAVGVALLALGAVRVRALAAALGIVIALVGIAVGLLAVGIPADLLRPGSWDELGQRLSHGLAGISQVELPYAGPNPWTRVGILALVPPVLVVAAGLLFWPSTGGGVARRATALVVLVVLYGVAVTWEAPTAELARGLGLLACVAAFIWLPRLPGRRALGAAAAVGVAGLAAVPAAASIGASDPVVDYRGWRLFGNERVIRFDWDHRYGPLDWPQRGIELFEVTGVNRPLYWKTSVLDDFDGFRWFRGDGVAALASTSAAANEIDGASDRLVDRRERWVEDFDVSVRALSSTVLVTTGITRGVTGVDVSPSAADGTTSLLGSPLEEGSAYEVTAYSPDPTARLLRRVDDRPYPEALARYTTLLLPQERGFTGTAPEAAPTDPLVFVQAPLRGSGDGGASQFGLPLETLIANTPYEGVRRLALRLTRDEPGSYEAVAAVERYLLDNYEYEQNVRERDHPLPAFLFRDRAGYCQQFSGAMALILRLAGIPARVVTGFAPGLPGDERGSYVVRDTDAHSWVEVWFPKVGWVTVDPTPSAAPARTETSITTSGLNADLVSGVGRAFSIEESADPGPLGDSPVTTPEREDEDSSAGGILGALVFAGIGAATFAYRRRRGRLLSPEGAGPQLRELERALPKLGHRLEPGATLLGIERQLATEVGPEAARYPAALRRNRYRPGRPRRPGPSERRALRRALGRGHGPRGRMRALLLIPPGGPSPRR